MTPGTQYLIRLMLDTIPSLNEMLFASVCD